MSDRLYLIDAVCQRDRKIAALQAKLDDVIGHCLRGLHSGSGPAAHHAYGEVLDILGERPKVESDFVNNK